MNNKELVKQTELPEPYLSYGCNFRSLSAIAEIAVDALLTKDQCLSLGEKAIKEGWMLEDCTVLKPEQLINETFTLLNSWHRVRNVGYINEKDEALNWAGTIINSFDFIIIRVLHSCGVGDHFVLADKDREIIYDPTPRSISVKIWQDKGGDRIAAKAMYLYKVI